jgi:predicted PurR-regulated permease PerM
VRETAQELDRAAAETAAGPNASAKAAAPVAPATASVSTSLFAWAGGNVRKVVAGLAQAAVVFLFAFFLLASGDLLRRKMVDIAGPSLANKKQVLRILSGIKTQVSGYLFQTLLINVLVGLAIAAAFNTLGVARPALWGLAALTLRFVPYVGTSVLIAAAMIAAFIQSASYGHTLLMGGTVLCIEGLIGIGMGTWTQSRIARVNATAVFLGMLFFGWLWGPWGVFLGAPLVGIGRLICGQFPRLRPVTVFLSR